jgi:hypothetical protein
MCAMSMAPDELQERTQKYRDMAGMAAFITGQGDVGFHEFDEWLSALTHHSTEPDSPTPKEPQ